MQQTEHYQRNDQRVMSRPTVFKHELTFSNDSLTFSNHSLVHQDCYDNRWHCKEVN